MIGGTPADYSMSAQHVLDVVATNPAATTLATPYLVLAWRRLLMADNSADWPVPHDSDMTRAVALFQTRKEALGFIKLMVALGSSLRFSAQEPPLSPAPRPKGKPRRFPLGGVERPLSRILHSGRAGAKGVPRWPASPRDG
jgi:hypothetical protein